VLSIIPVKIARSRTDQEQLRVLNKIRPDHNHQEEEQLNFLPERKQRSVSQLTALF
jgi:hypothetical protein